MTHSTPDAGYPFTAVVGQDQLRLALILNAISPRIGGVVVRGEKGTAKTTTVRAFAALLDGAPLVNLPIGATEDRVVGSLDVETVLTTGRAEYHPGLLAQADGGVLYVDEVNLLADHLVDTLLDAAATGRVTIERDGISHISPADFVLVGTMNPEEGELRPQLLDRFGLAVDVAASRDVEIRAEIIRRRLDYEADPAGFASAWEGEDADLAARITRAREILPEVELTGTNLARIAHICASFDVDGMRADLVIARAAAACAAYRGDTAVTDEDIRTAAQLALPHRRRRDPFDEPGLDEDKLDETMDEARDQHPEPESQAESYVPEPDDNPEPDDAQDQQSPEPQRQPEEPSEQPTDDGKVGRAEQGAPFRPQGSQA
ncbi:AAA family ATPase [Corynebacterium sp. CCM 9185]|uniref:AAA family ATPase n=1 Tax=Corynebacterium marambiense TaxID=2765364 RepID=A0ABS0VVC3_9CORY|nr:AAA family ATPase [Corynebacterium marambiense]MBI9000718.1 AAA family ATPase [Corynebacterium marambiense]MCK7663019.1 AAA family ATPase [Corynebacterium marambiense]MCX7542633.1 AAA family ATPase [Corynebacterium marambiense]